MVFQEDCTNLTEKAIAPHSSILAWQIPWKEEPGRLQSMGSLGVRHSWVTSLSVFTFMHWRRKWEQPTPVFLPGESQGPGSLVGAVSGVAQSRTRLKRLSSSSSSTNLKSWSKDSLHTPPPPHLTHGETKALSHCWFNLHAGMHAQWFSLVRLFATLWTVARQAPLSMGFSSKNAGMGCHFLLFNLPIFTQKASEQNFSFKICTLFQIPLIKKARKRETNWWRKMMKMNSD